MSPACTLRYPSSRTCPCRRHGERPDLGRGQPDAKLTTLANAATGQLNTPVSRLKSSLATLQEKLKAVAGGTGSVKSAVSALGGVLAAGESP
jgi:hypothetical protein